MTQTNGLSRVMDPYVDGEGRWLSRNPGQITKLYHVVGTQRTPAEFFKIGIYTILPGESAPVHEHSGGEEFAFVLSGHGLLLGERDQQIGPLEKGKLVHVPPSAFHGYANRSAEPLELLVWTSKGAGLDC